MSFTKNNRTPLSIYGNRRPDQCQDNGAPSSRLFHTRQSTAAKHMNFGHQCGHHARDRKSILEVVEKYKRLGERIVPIGKAGEVVRGLYERCNVAQFLVLPRLVNHSVETLPTVSRHQNHFWSHNGIGGYGFTSDRPNRQGLTNPLVRTNGIMIPDGIFYTLACYYHHDYVLDGLNTVIKQTEDPRAYYILNEDMVDADGLIPIGINARWYHSMGFYDSEMSNSLEFNSVVSMVESIGGDNFDVVAIRALFKFAEKRDGSSLAALEEKLAKVKNPEHYSQFVKDIKDVLSMA